MDDLPNNGDSVIDSCLNCESLFEDPQKLNEWILCDPDDLGCGFHFKLTANVGKLEK